jgi:signal transduction histidine kinase
MGPGYWINGILQWLRRVYAEKVAPRVRMSSSAVRPLRRPWLVLLAGFSGLLVLMAAAGFDAVLALNRLHDSSVEVRQRFFSRTRLLDQIRSQIYLSGTDVRDYLLAPAPAGTEAQRRKLESLQQANRSALAQYARGMDARELPVLRALQSEVEAYWRVLDQTLGWTPAQRDRERYAFFYEELMPRRTAMLQIADRVAEADGREFSRGEEQAAESFSRYRLESVTTLAVTLAGGILVAVLSCVYLFRLEREAARRFNDATRAEAELKELSARLVRAQEDERRALSRELHDELGQSFSAIAMETGNLLDLNWTPEAGNGARGRLEAIRDLAGKGVDATRNMSLLLRPSMLDDFGLAPALQWQVRETARRTGMRVHLAAGHVADDLPEEHKTCIYRIVQEALNNAARHAQARNVQVTVRDEPERIHVTIQDDGGGFDPRRVRGLGLLGMQERVRHLGGRFLVDSSPGRGAVVTVELPRAVFAEEENGAAHSHTPG